MTETSTTDTTDQTVVVAGASGFIGRALPERLAGDFRLVGLSRDPADAQGGQSNSDYRWRRCDLFSRRQAFEALAGADRAVYLVHSMLPSADLSQGEFIDMDLICADNFARAADRRGVDQIVYVGRLRGDDSSARRRGEVAAVLDSYAPSLTTLRAGFVVGAGGAGTDMLVRLVERLPVMALPTWTSSRVSPIARDDLVELIAYALANPDRSGSGFDVGGGSVTTYRQMLAMVAETLGLSRRFFRVPFETPRLSSHWISTVTGQPYSLVEPLVERFRRDLIPGDRQFQQMADQQPVSVRTALESVCRETEPIEESAPPVPETEQETGLIRSGDVNVVRSVQRLVLPRDWTTSRVAAEYARWLPGFMGPLIRARRDGGTVQFFPGRLPWPLLVLQLDDRVSRPDRRLFWIRGGLLVAPHPEARLEFRKIPGKRAVLTAIHQYRPRLPWLLYLTTQARAHHFVMQSFGRHLEDVDRRLRDRRPGLEESARVETDPEEDVDDRC